MDRLAVGEVVLGDRTRWSLAVVDVVAVDVLVADQINDGRSWTEVLDDAIADRIDRQSKPISELADGGWIWRPSSDAQERFG